MATETTSDEPEKRGTGARRDLQRRGAGTCSAREEERQTAGPHTRSEHVCPVAQDRDPALDLRMAGDRRRQGDEQREAARRDDELRIASPDAPRREHGCDRQANRQACPDEPHASELRLQDITDE